MLKKLLPQLRVNSIYEVDFEQLKNSGIKAIITDLDNTLVGAKERLATPELVSWLERLKADGFKVVIVSNNNRSRVSVFAEPLGIPFVFKAMKPRNAAFNKALKLLGMKANEVAMIGDQMLTDVFGGNRMGMYTILVKPISIHDESFFTRINRRIEKRALVRLKRKGLISWEDEG